MYFLVALALHFCAWAVSNCSKRGAASLSCGTQALGCVGFNSCGARAELPCSI